MTNAYKQRRVAKHAATKTDEQITRKGARSTAEKTMTIQELLDSELYQSYLKGFIAGEQAGKDWAPTAFMLSNKNEKFRVVTFVGEEKPQAMLAESITQFPVYIREFC